MSNEPSEWEDIATECAALLWSESVSRPMAYTRVGKEYDAKVHAAIQRFSTAKKKALFDRADPEDQRLAMELQP